MLADLITQWVRAPFDLTQWTLAVLNRKAPVWSSDNRVVIDTPIAKLRDFSTTYSDVTPTIILPPMAGHASTIVDYPGQSQVELVLKHGLTHLYVIDWQGATQATKHTSIQDRMAFIDRCVNLTAGKSGKVNLIGNCQGGWEATLYTALHPERVNTLTAAGAPIDTHAGDSPMKPLMPLLAPGGNVSLFQLIALLEGGVWPGVNMIAGFMLMHPLHHQSEHIKLYAQINDPKVVKRFSDFYDWYFNPVNLPGALYLWAVENLFVKNKLYKGTLTLDGKPVRLSAITCPVFLLAGEEDDITPAPQMLNMANAVSSGYIWQETAPGGHIGLFIGSRSQREYWPRMLTRVKSMS